MIDLLMVLFVATQHPTHHNCALLRDVMIEYTELAWCPKNDPPAKTLCPNSLRKEVDKIRVFASTVCKDGFKR